ncbi:MAG: hypothetical protein IH859_02975 [Chloroflexi bacterium]|nr:hypothetical protein [Chloroflexota bacterium]
MGKNEHKNHTDYRFFLISLPPVILYILILVIEIPYSFSQFFRTYSITLFSLALIVYFLSFQMNGKSGWLLGLSITALLFGLTLSYNWTSGYSDNRILGGLLPYKDGYDYYNGARQLLNGQLLVGRSAGRPLFPGFLSTLLLITQQNLQLTLATLTALTGFTSYITARQVRHSFGPLPAAIFMALLYSYILPYIGLAWTELLGLIFGCLGFILLWQTARTLRLRDLVFGIAVLMVGVSTRSGAFIIFPMLVIWAGLMITKNQQFSLPSTGIALSAVLLSYWVANGLYPVFVVTSGYSTFTQFAFAIYGQVSGGTGWFRAIEDLRTMDPSIVFDAALQIFIAHPLSFPIAVAKSYRDFFLPSVIGIFPLYSVSGNSFLDLTLWIAALALLIRGLFISGKKWREPSFFLLIAAFLGIFLSVPFLPPIDGGRRFYASTMPFFFALPAVGISGIINQHWIPSDINGLMVRRTARMLSVFLAIITIIIPVMIQRFSPSQSIQAQDCPTGEVPFAIRVDPGSYIDLDPGNSFSCGSLPNICLDDFKANGVEKNIDPFYQSLVIAAESRNDITRIITTNDLLGGKYHFFVGPAGMLQPSDSSRIVTGCGTTAKSPSTYFVEP